MTDFSPLALITPAESRWRDGTPITPTLSGSVREVPFDGGVGWMVEEGTTNYVIRALPLSTLASWGTGATGQDRDYIADVEIHHPDGFVLNHLARSTVTGATSNGTRLSYGVGTGRWLVNEPMTAQLLVRGSGEAIGMEYDLGMSPTGGTWQARIAGDPVVITSDWQLLTVTGVITVNDATNMFISLRNTNYPAGVVGEVVEMTALQLEHKPYATTFAHGDMGAGYSWAGTAHASTSTRAQGYLTVPSSLIPIDGGSLYMRFALGQGSLPRYLFQTGTEGANGFTGYLPSGRVPQFYIRSAETDEYNSVTALSAIQLGPTNSLYTEWGDSFGIILNGGDKATRDNRTPKPPSTSTLAIGGHVSISTRQINGPVACMILFDRPLSEAEIRLLDGIPTADLTWDNIVLSFGSPTQVESPLAFGTGFGVVGTQDFVEFDILADTRSGMYGAWMPQIAVVEDGIVGSMHSEVQITHVGLPKLSLRLQFDSRDDYFKLQSMLTKQHTLVLIAGFVPHKGDTYHWRGQDYQRFPDTLLTSLSPTFGIDDTEAIATFWRAPDLMGITL